MADNELSEFSDDSIAEIARTVRTLRWQVQNVQEMLREVKRHRPTHEIRTGIMKARPNTTYPSSGCILPVQFHDAHFVETEGTCPVTQSTPWTSKFVTARTYDGKYIDEDTHVLIVKVSSRIGRRWWIIPVFPKDLVLLSPVECFKSFPVTPTQMKVWELIEGEWSESAEIVYAEDQTDSNFLLPGEKQWATRRGNTTVTTPTGEVQLYDLVGSKGLRRRVKANADIACGASGSATVHEVATCTTQDATECTIDVCNAWGGRQCIKDTEELEAQYIKSGVWTAIHQRNKNWEAALVGPMDSDETGSHEVTGVTPWDFCEDAEVSQAITSAINKYGLAGIAGDYVKLERNNASCDGEIYITQVLHKCRDVAVAEEPCEGDGQFLFLDQCEGDGSGSGGEDCTLAIWTYNGTTQLWEETTPCEAGCVSNQDPNDQVFAIAPSNNDTIAIPCVASSPPSRKIRGTVQVKTAIMSSTEDPVLKEQLELDTETFLLDFEQTADGCFRWTIGVRSVFPGCDVDLEYTANCEVACPTGSGSSSGSGVCEGNWTADCINNVWTVTSACADGCSPGQIEDIIGNPCEPGWGVIVHPCE